MVKRFLINILASAAHRVVEREKPTVVAITGSFGKSSAKEAIAAVLGAHEPGSRVRYSTKNYNNEFGLPFTIFGVSAPGHDPIKWLRVLGGAFWLGWGWGKMNADVLVLEMGSDRPGDLAWLTKIVRPNVAVITSVGMSHAEHFGSIDAIANEKATLVRALAENGIAILNNDDSRVTAMRKEFSGEAVYFGFSEGSDIRIQHADIVTAEDEFGHNIPQGIGVTIEEQGKAHDFLISGTIGRPHALAVSAAIAVGKAFDIPIQTAIERLERDYRGMPGRTRIIQGIKHTIIIDDSYNASSPKTILSVLYDIERIPLADGQRRIAAIGEMRELGQYSESAHREVGAKVAHANIDILVCCGTLAPVIAEAAIANGMDASRVHTFANSLEAGRFLQNEIKSGDLILVKGSQGSRMEKVVKELMAEPLQAPFLLVRMSDEWQKIK
ncbi:MAG: UDP-N-acetylmuramoyl-tripeptide--D-alanyl-D-alanine ligase [Patescibacteria group bacterium]